MADGSGLVSRGKVVAVGSANSPRLREVSSDQVIVGCCDRCGAVGRVDPAMWPLEYEREGYLYVLRRHLRCNACCGKAVSLQLWLAAPYPDERRPAFHRWR